MAGCEKVLYISIDVYLYIWKYSVQKCVKCQRSIPEVICRKPRDTLLQRIPSSLLHVMAKYYLAQATASVVKGKGLVIYNLILFLLDALCDNPCLNFPGSKRHTVIPKHVWFSRCQSINISWRCRLNKFSSLQFHRNVTEPMASQQGQHILMSDGAQLDPVQGTVPHLSVRLALKRFHPHCVFARPC